MSASRAIADLVEQMGEDAFKEALISELKFLAETQPDFCYVTAEQLSSTPCRARCSYNSGPAKRTLSNAAGWEAFPDNTEEQNKGCIFGQAIRKLGVEIGDDTSNISSLLIQSCGMKFADACWNIQGEQDSGAKWGSLNIDSLKGL